MPRKMDDIPLLMSTSYDRAVFLHGAREIVFIEHAPSTVRTTNAETDVGVRRLTAAFGHWPSGHG